MTHSTGESVYAKFDKGQFVDSDSGISSFCSSPNYHGATFRQIPRSFASILLAWTFLSSGRLTIVENNCLAHPGWYPEIVMGLYSVLPTGDALE